MEMITFNKAKELIESIEKIKTDLSRLKLIISNEENILINSFGITLELSRETEKEVLFNLEKNLLSSLNKKLEEFKNL